MRIQVAAWSILLNSKERVHHPTAFPQEQEQPYITIRRLLPENRYVVESEGPDGKPRRLAKTGRWEHYAVNGKPLAAHRFSTLESALNVLERGTELQQASAPRPMEGTHAAA